MAARHRTVSGHGTVDRQADVQAIADIQLAATAHMILRACKDIAPERH